MSLQSVRSISFIDCKILYFSLNFRILIGSFLNLIMIYDSNTYLKCIVSSVVLNLFSVVYLNERLKMQFDESGF